jgi:hypothetical protein
MGIFEDHQHRSLTRQGFRLGKERLQRALPSLLRIKRQCGVTALIRQG